VSVKRTKTGYQVDVRLADDKRHRKSFRTKQAADKYEREMLDQREQGVLPTHGSGTLADFIAEWKSTVYPTIRANTISGYESALNQHILPAFGELKLQKIDQRLVQDWVNDLVAEGLSPRTVELNFAVLSTISKLASEYRLMKPLKKSGRGRGGVRLPRNVPKTRKPPTIGEIEHLVHVIDPPYKAMVRLAGYCGLRQSECWGLHPSSIDFERHKIHIRRTVEHTTRSLVDLTKSGKPRTVTMTAPVAESLREHMASWPHPEYVFHHNGRYIESGHFHRDVWDRARKAAGLPDLWFHDLRHAAPTIMAAAGWGPKKVQLELGHHSASFTLDRYGHLFAEEEDSARTTLNSALEQAIEAAKNTGDGSRTHTGLSPDDFESSASSVPPRRPADDTTEEAS
jgi:integrase